MVISLSDGLHVLGIKDYNPSTRYRCPLCNSSDGLSVGEGRSGVLFNCHANNCHVYEWIAERVSKPKVALNPSFANKVWRNAQKQRTSQKQEEQIERRVERAHEILAAAKSSGQQPEAYLKRRGLQHVPSSAYLLPADAKASPFPGHPCAVFEVKGGNACHVVALNERGDGKAAMDNPKRTFGLFSGRYVEVVASDPDQPLIIAEGIETGLAASQLAGDLPAIATLGTSGMKAVRIPKCSEVIIARDNGEAGKAAAEQLGADLADSHTVRIVAPPERWGDWNDALKSPRAERWWKLALDQAREATARCHAFTMTEFCSLEVPKVGYYMEPIIPNRGMVQLSARSGGGKTRLALSLAYAMATGTPLLGWKVPQPIPVLYIDAELHPGIMQSWVDRLEKKTDNLLILSDKVNYAKGWPRVTLQTVEGRKYVSGVIEEVNPNFIIFDSLFTLTTPDLERDIQIWNELMPWFENQTLKERVLLLLHHDNKGGHPFGTSTREIEFEGIMQLKRMEKHNTSDRHAFQLGWYKVRHLTPDEAKPQIITCNHEGVVDWQNSDHDVSIKSRRILDSEARKERVRKMKAQGKTRKEIAEIEGVSTEAIRQIEQKLD